MYQPAAFRQDDPDLLQAFVRDYPFALLITAGPDGPMADPLPFILDSDAAGGTVLRGHLARANPHAQALLAAGGQSALACFQGPHTYISPGWYATKRQHGKVVPTWNYTMVQATGTVHPVEDPHWLRQLLRDLTDRHEAGHAVPWSIDDAPADFTATLLRAIVGVEVRVSALTGKWKLSQNRSAADRRGVIDGLAGVAGDDAAAIAALMADGLADGHSDD